LIHIKTIGCNASNLFGRGEDCGAEMQRRVPKAPKGEAEIERLIASLGLHGVLELVASALDKREHDLLADQARRLAFKTKKIGE
jgi:hypothetical protein